jgi:hypothetical protein
LHYLLDDLSVRVEDLRARRLRVVRSFVLSGNLSKPPRKGRFQQLPGTETSNLTLRGGLGSVAELTDRQQKRSAKEKEENLK